MVIILKFYITCQKTSRKFKPNEQNYIIFEKELLAIKLGINSFHIYVAPENLNIRTDNRDVKDFFY